ncbi:hypothetical protein OBK01_02055 [Empedobacter falsenii]
MNFKTHVSRKNYQWVKWSRIALCSALVGIVVGLLTLMFKTLVEQYEHLLLHKAKDFQGFLLFLLYRRSNVLNVASFFKSFLKMKYNNSEIEGFS